jgi:uncharacterized protein
MKIAAIGDLHCRIYTNTLIDSLLPDIQNQADVLIMTGDLTDTGLPEEADTLVNQLRQLRLPVITVLGNHDFENGKEDEIKAILRKAGIILLDSSAFEIGDIGFVGTKGFCGGVGKNLLQPFGEKAIKRFVEAGMHEAVELESVLARTECKRRVAVLHYSPIKETLQGESTEIYPFLGSEHLAAAIDRQGVDFVLHGHAHHGSPEGRTAGGIPVYNVSRYVLDQHFKRNYCLLEISNPS